MPAHPRHPILTTVILAGVAGACAHDRDLGEAPGVTHTTAAVLSNQAAVLKVATARCRRLAECNRFGDGHMFANEAQCRTAYMDEAADVEVLRDCRGGVEASRLDICVARLMDQNCDAHMGPVTDMGYCRSYCAAPASSRGGSSMGTL